MYVCMCAADRPFTIMALSALTNIENCRVQNNDNVRNLSDTYSGMQAEIIKYN